MCKHKQAFTLIELLVVVLIIGILSAIALPQYQKAVAKSRIATMLPLAKAIVDAKEIYYIQNGEYSRDTTVLGVDVPATCSYLYTGIYSCGSDFVFGNNSDNLIIRYCPGKNTDNLLCSQNQILRLIWTQQYYDSDREGDVKGFEPGKGYCVGRTAYGRSICKSIPELIYEER